MATEQTFRVAKIVYFTDLTVAGAPVIPLGSLAEVRLAHGHALALKARVGLEPNELRAISPLIRDQVANPFAFYTENSMSLGPKLFPGRRSNSWLLDMRLV